MRLNVFNEQITQFKNYYLSSVKNHIIDLTSQEDIKDKVIDLFISTILSKCDFNNHESTEEYEIAPPAFYGGKSVSIDYALINKTTGNSDIFIEVKRSRSGKKLMINKLDYSSNHLYKLPRYFLESKDNVAYIILTNGKDYWFYSDFKKMSKLDDEPFFKFDLVNYSNADLINLHYILNCNFDRKKLKIRFHNGFNYTNNIRKYREIKGFTQKQMGKKLGFTEQRFGAIERNQHDLGISLAVSIAEILEVPLDDLFTWPNFNR